MQSSLPPVSVKPCPAVEGGAKFQVKHPPVLTVDLNLTDPLLACTRDETVIAVKTPRPQSEESCQATRGGTPTSALPQCSPVPESGSFKDLGSSSGRPPRRVVLPLNPTVSEAAGTRAHPPQDPLHVNKSKASSSGSSNLTKTCHNDAPRPRETQALELLGDPTLLPAKGQEAPGRPPRSPASPLEVLPVMSCKLYSKSI